jgi:hypothetical protein
MEWYLLIWCVPFRRKHCFCPAGTAYTRSGIVVATDSSLNQSGAVATAYMAKIGRLPARSVAVFGQLSSIRPGLTRILALGDCTEIV